MKEALNDEYWVNAIRKNLLNLKQMKYGNLFLNIIKKKWIYKNTTDGNKNVNRNKSCHVAQGYTQIKWADFDKTFDHVSRLESIRLLVGFSCILKFMLYQMDVKSFFLNRYLDEEVFIDQPKGFIDHYLPNHIYKLRKYLYGLKQAHRA